MKNYSLKYKLDKLYNYRINKNLTLKIHLSQEIKECSKLSIDEWREFFNDNWNFSGIKQKEHDVMFPDELPKRLIKMYSFKGDTILDPFTGSGTTNKVASSLGRNSIGFEVGFNRDNWKTIIKNKTSSNVQTNIQSKFYYINS